MKMNFFEDKFCIRTISCNTGEIITLQMNILTTGAQSIRSFRNVFKQLQILSVPWKYSIP